MTEEEVGMVSVFSGLGFSTHCNRRIIYGSLAEFGPHSPKTNQHPQNYWILQGIANIREYRMIREEKKFIAETYLMRLK